MPLFLTETDVQALVGWEDMPEAIDVVERAYREKAAGRATCFPRATVQYPPEHGYYTDVASRKFVKDHPVTVERFVAALARANDYLNSNREELVKFTAEYTKSKPEIIRELTLDRWTHIVVEKDVQLLADPVTSTGSRSGPSRSRR